MKASQTAKKSSKSRGKVTPTQRQRPSNSQRAEIDFIVEMVNRRFGGHVPRETLETAISFRSLPTEAKLSKAREIITDTIIKTSRAPDILFPLAVAASQNQLISYSTLDFDHYTQIEALMMQIKQYLADASRKRPLNVLMLASPGAGKSHFIKQLAQAMRGHQVKAVTFNMATMQSPDDMAQPIDSLRNLKVDDQFPLLFLDEFDSDPARYAALLPLLWDGELQIGHRDLKLGKAVIVLAGSNPDLPKVMAHSGAMRIDGGSVEGQPTGKLVDLLSRINGGVIEIPDLDLQSETRDRRIDKVCIAVALLRSRFGADIKEVPRSLLRFIAGTTFRYGVRSIAHLVDVIDSKPNEKLPQSGSRATRLDALVISPEALPMANERELEKSSLRFHLLDKDRAFGIVSRWKECSRDKTAVGLDNEVMRFIPYLRSGSN